jgi:hypothetical protein
MTNNPLISQMIVHSKRGDMLRDAQKERQILELKHSSFLKEIVPELQMNKLGRRMVIKINQLIQSKA